MSLTVREQQLVDGLKVMLPANFQTKSSDEQLKAYLNTVLCAINLTTPPTSYTLDNMPTTWDCLIQFGGVVISNMFVQLGYALKDFSYSDYGLSLNIDRGAKIQAVSTQMTKAYDKMVWDAKKGVLLGVGPRGFGMPRYQSQIGQFLKIVYGSTFAWGSSPG